MKSKYQDVKCGVPQGSVLGPLILLIYINDLNKAIKYSTTHHFVDDPNLLVVAGFIHLLEFSFPDFS